MDGLWEKVPQCKAESVFVTHYVGIEERLLEEYPLATYEKHLPNAQSHVCRLTLSQMQYEWVAQMLNDCMPHFSYSY